MSKPAPERTPFCIASLNGLFTLALLTAAPLRALVGLMIVVPANYDEFPLILFVGDMRENSVAFIAAWFFIIPNCSCPSLVF